MVQPAGHVEAGAVVAELGGRPARVERLLREEGRDFVRVPLGDESAFLQVFDRLRREDELEGARVEGVAEGVVERGVRPRSFPQLVERVGPVRVEIRSGGDGFGGFFESFRFIVEHSLEGETEVGIECVARLLLLELEEQLAGPPHVSTTAERVRGVGKPPEPSDPGGARGGRLELVERKIRREERSFRAVNFERARARRSHGDVGADPFRARVHIVDEAGSSAEVAAFQGASQLQLARAYGRRGGRS